MKKLYMTLCGILLFSTMLCAQISQPWAGDTATTFGGGSGTQENPYLIKTGAELALIAKNVGADLENSYKDIYFKLENDLDMGGLLPSPSNWVPIGGNNKMARTFKGTFEGNHKKIHNLYINRAENTHIALFGCISAEASVKNLSILNGKIIGKQNVSSIAGLSYGRVENCVNYANISTPIGSGLSRVGGIVSLNYGYIGNCVNFGNLIGDSYVGGLASTITKTTQSAGLVENSANYGTLTTRIKITVMGGLTAELGKGGVLQNCSNYGELINTIEDVMVKNIGGIVGKMIATTSRVENCYNTGNILIEGLVGGIYGEKSPKDTLRNCYNDKQMSGKCYIYSGDSILREGNLLTSEMTTAEGLVGFDASIWSFHNGTYPILKNLEGSDYAKTYAIPLILSNTNAQRYDIFNAVKNDFRLGDAFNAEWSIKKGSTLAIEGSQVKITRSENKDDSIILAVKVGDYTREIPLIILQKPLTLTLIQGTEGVFKAYDGEFELISPALVEPNTKISLKAESNETHLLDFFTIDGVRIEEDFFTMTKNCTISAVYMKATPPAPWDATIATEFGGGTGKERAPYLIKTPQQLAFLAKSVNEGNSYDNVYFKIVFDLDLNHHPWTPIGYLADKETNRPFLGKLNGNNKIISKMFIESGDLKQVGLFGNVYIGAFIENLGLDTNCRIICTSMSTGSVGGLAGINTGDIKNCYFKGSIFGASGSTAVGGIIGSGGGRITNCHNEGIIEVNTQITGGIVGAFMVGDISNSSNTAAISGNALVGGIAGSSNSSNIHNSYNSGTLKSTNGPLGGIIGSSGGSTRTASISSCLNTGSLICEKVVVGGIVGMNAGSVSHSYNTGNVIGSSYVGGIVGRLTGGVQGKMETCYNLGNVSATDASALLGELLGSKDLGFTFNLYYDQQIKGFKNAVGNYSNSLYCGGLPTMTLASFKAPGFDTVHWVLEQGQYPILKKLPLNDLILFHAAALTLAAENDSVFETLTSVRTSFSIYTKSGVQWSLEKGNTAAIKGDSVIITPLTTGSDTLIIKAKFNKLEKTYTIVVPRLAYKLNIAAVSGGKIVATDSSGDIITSGVEIKLNQKLNLQAYPDRGYQFKAWGDKTTQNPQKLTVTGNLSVSAVFEKQTYQIIASADKNGNIVPKDTNTVAYNANITFTITPNEGYEIAYLRIDGEQIEAVPSYTFTKVDTNHTIHAAFIAKTLKMTSSCSENGTISPKGEIQVNYGANQEYTFTPDKNYHIESINVDGAKVPVTEKYTFSTVIAEHNIHVVFAENVSNEESPLSQIRVWTSNRILYIENSSSGAVDVSVNNMRGVQYFRNILSKSTQISISHTGVYIVTLRNSDSVLTQKIFIGF